MSVDSITMNLDGLADSRNYVEPLDISGQSGSFLLNCLEKMIEIRQVEDGIARLVIDGRSKTPCHLATGQEAVAVGVASSLNRSDRVFGGHRSHSHFLSLGGDVVELLAEVMGKVTGASRGRGGSMHLIDSRVGFHGSVPIVAGTISIAVGAALACKMDKSNAVAVCFFGDGAAEEGVLHEAMNFAAVQNLPVLFVCENNLFSSHLDIELRQPGSRVARFADSHGIESRTIDGNNVLSVSAAAAELIGIARGQAKPGFLEAVTFRHKGHVGPNDDIDVGVHRSMEEVRSWKRRDPIARLADAMMLSGVLEESDFKKLQLEVSKRVDAAIVEAEAADYPAASELLSHVYSEDAE